MELLKAIVQLEEKIKKGKKHYIYDCGICENLSAIGNKFYHFQIKQLIKDWKHYSGEETYPVGGIDEYNHHKSNETLWQGEQLKLRLDLIKHLKSKLKD